MSGVMVKFDGSVNILTKRSNHSIGYKSDDTKHFQNELEKKEQRDDFDDRN